MTVAHTNEMTSAVAVTATAYCLAVLAAATCVGTEDLAGVSSARNCPAVGAPSCDSVNDGGLDNKLHGEPRASADATTPPLRLRVLGSAPFWPTPVLVESHGEDVVHSLLQLVLWEHHRDPVGVLKSNKRDGGWHSVSLMNASAALGSLR